MNATVRKEILNYFKENRSEVITILNEISPDEFKNKTQEDVWSISEIIEHIISVEIGVLSQLKKLKASGSEVELIDVLPNDVVIKKCLNRNIKVDAPKVFLPRGIFQTKIEAIEGFSKHRDGIEEFIQNNQSNLKEVSFPHARLGVLNGENWLAFMVGHCKRHIDQINQILSA